MAPRIDGQNPTIPSQPFLENVTMNEPDVGLELLTSAVAELEILQEEHLAQHLNLEPAENRQIAYDSLIDEPMDTSSTENPPSVDSDATVEIPRYRSANSPTPPPSISAASTIDHAVSSV